MPSAISRHTSPNPREVRPSKVTLAPRAVRFDSGALVTGVSRPMQSSEAWAIYNFEEHAQRCSSCYRPYEVQKAGGQLCDRGHSLAQSVASQLYSDRSGIVYSHAKEDQQRIHVEVPLGFEHSLQLLRAHERSLRHRRRGPFVTFEPSHFNAPRATPKSSPRLTALLFPSRQDTFESFPAFEEPRSHRHHHHHHHRKHYHSSPKAHIVEWPDFEDPTPVRARPVGDSFDPFPSSKDPYAVEVIEPSFSVKSPKRRAHRRSRYW